MALEKDEKSVVKDFVEHDDLQYNIRWTERFIKRTNGKLPTDTQNSSVGMVVVIGGTITFVELLCASESRMGKISIPVSMNNYFEYYKDELHQSFNAIWFKTKEHITKYGSVPWE